MTETVAFIGLGTMGFPMAGHLARAGHQVTVFNRTQTVAEAWAKNYSGRPPPPPLRRLGVLDSFSSVWVMTTICGKSCLARTGLSPA